jgi:hypothetical protein
LRYVQVEIGNRLTLEDVGAVDGRDVLLLIAVALA